MVQASQTGLIIPGMQIASMRLSVPLLRVFGEFLEHPEKRSGLVRVVDNRQLAMTESSAIMLRRNWNTQQAVQRSREEYFFEPDLVDFESPTSGWRTHLELNNPDSYWDFRWRAKDAAGEPWRWFSNRYRLVSDEFEDIYHVSENLGWDDIKIPVLEG